MLPYILFSTFILSLPFAELTPVAGGSGLSKIGIFDIRMVGVDPSLQQTAMDALATAAAGLEGFQVISRSDLNAMLGVDKMKETLGCDDVSCLAEIGLAAGVDRVVAGSVSQVEKNLIVSLQLVNGEYATVENRITVEWDGGVAKLSDVLGVAAELLLLPAKKRLPGNLLLDGLPTTAVVSIDGAARGMGNARIDNLAVGVHRLRVTDKGFETLDLPFVIRSGRESMLSLTMVAKAEKPFYATWWFWTATAAVVAGATGVTVWAVTKNEKASSLASGSFTVPQLPGAIEVRP